MPRKVTIEYAQRFVKRNGVMYKFERDSSPLYDYVELRAWKWTGYTWNLLHSIELY